jgi:RND family efflux transporter MFP subunit
VNSRDNAASGFLIRLRCVLRFASVAGLTLVGSNCATDHSAEAQKAAAPAKVENAVKEGDLAIVTLSPEAEGRLGITTAPVEFTTVTQTRAFGGDVVLPPDSTITVSAPMAGTLMPGASGSAPAAGTMVKKGQAVFRLLPLLPPERDARALAQKEVSDAETRVDNSKVRLNRAEELLREKAGSVKQVEQAREELALAESALKAAREKLDRIIKTPLSGDASIAIVSPDDGMVQKVLVSTGQNVAGSTALFEIASVRSMWVRVPVYAGDLSSINRRQPASVHDLGDSAGSPMLSAKPIDAPPTANPNASTVDLYYQLPPGSQFRPGQKVGVTLTLLGGQESLVVPQSAIIRDVHGGEWVYESLAAHQYVRRRVEVRYVAGTQAVLARGPAAGTQIVTTGVAELFGTEFGGGK